MGDLFFEGMRLRLCSAWNDDHKVTCDLAAEHAGEHKATLYWGSNGDDES